MKNTIAERDVLVESLLNLRTEMIANGHDEYAMKLNSCIYSKYPVNHHMDSWNAIYKKYASVGVIPGIDAAGGQSDVVKVDVKYVVSGIDSNGNRVYRASDTHSGGYPYWSQHIHSSEVRKYSSIEHLQKHETLASDDKVVDVDVYKLETTISKTSRESIANDLRATAERQIEEILKGLQDQLSKLEKE